MHRLEYGGLYFCRMAGGIGKVPAQAAYPPELLEGLRTTALSPISLTTYRVLCWDCKFYPVKWTDDNKHVPQWTTGVCLPGLPNTCHPTGPLGWGAASSWVKPGICWGGGSGAETCPGTPECQKASHDPARLHSPTAEHIPKTEPQEGLHFWPRPQGPQNNLSDTERVPKVTGTSDDPTLLFPTPRNPGGRLSDHLHIGNEKSGQMCTISCMSLMDVFLDG